ncbi:MAG: hypothetical protein ACKO37_06260 [Vampirovibrionales bacterium]
MAPMPNQPLLRILSHRGYWRVPQEKNTPEAFLRSFQGGFGTETDVRDLDGTLVIAHDIPTHTALTEGTILTLEAFLALYSSCCHAQGLAYQSLPLALNIKADGLQPLLQKTLETYHIPKDAYFLFDMSIPDALVSLRYALPCYTRMSEYETPPLAFFEQAQGVWLDAFHSTWYTPETHILPLLEAGKQVCIVSPELHQRAHLPLWESLHQLCKPLSSVQRGCLLLCTDLPEEAQAFFV